MRVSVATLLAFLSAGCSEPATGRLSGTVALDRRPAPDGIMLVTPEGQYRSTVKVPIRGGRYTADAVPVGRCRVVVSFDDPAVEPTGLQDVIEVAAGSQEWNLELRSPTR